MTTQESPQIGFRLPTSNTAPQPASPPSLPNPGSVAAGPSASFPGTSMGGTTVPGSIAPDAAARATPPSSYGTPSGLANDFNRPVPTAQGYAESTGGVSFAHASYAPGHSATGAPLTHTSAADSYASASSTPAGPYASGSTPYGFPRASVPASGPPATVHGGTASFGSAYQAHDSRTLEHGTDVSGIEIPEGFIPDPQVPPPSAPTAPPLDSAAPSSTAPDSTFPGSAPPVPGMPLSGQGAAQVPQVPGRTNCPPGLEYLVLIDQELEVQAPPGTPIAQIRQRWSICHPYFTVYSPQDEPALDVVGPICTESMPCKCDVKFEVRSMNGVAIGAVTKEWGGLVKEYFTDVDTFNVSFPIDLDVHMKAALLALSLLIDYMFFEESCKRNDDRAPGMVG
ncbi:hypothetical protein HPB50_005113 [Hyalomma asiaticum]|uniref:Uncharacterized protein n=1 Tax=Hyalomma asiaticum TaxID=266040 RepID=A0ACB7SXN8_HYAAI|nr:hypothetical protein HPB50_005113 [Hyalomma asiaticum]